MKVSILICTFGECDCLTETISSITESIPRRKHNFEIIIDHEAERTGLLNTTKRYMKLFEKSKGEIIVKSDDDVLYYPGWFEKCLEVIMSDDKIAYVSPISHQLMLRLGIRHASTDQFPIEPTKVNYESPLSGMCWVFRRWLWERYPYSICRNWKLDSEYSNLINRKDFVTAALWGALIEHLGGERYKGTPTDRSGKPASDEFKKKNPQTNFLIF